MLWYLISQVAEWKTHEKAGEIQTAPAMDDQVSSEGSHTGSNPVLSTKWLLLGTEMGLTIEI